jgi:putative transcriptional regulator
MDEEGDRMNTSVADRILERLQGFVDHIETSDKISDRFTCRKIDLDLQPETYTPEKVKDTRKILRASQPIFAKFLGVTARTVRAWEQGTNPPSDMACRFMDEIRRDPDYWFKRLSGVVKQKETSEAS